MAEFSHITEREADKVCTFMVWLCNALTLPPYTIIVMEEPAASAHEASIEPVGNRWAARLQLGVDWMDRDEYDRMKTLIHEACHLTHRSLDEAFNETFHYMHDYEYITVARRWNSEIELFVDHFAQMFADLPAVRDAWLNA